MIFRCRNGVCRNEIDPKKNKFCDDCIKKCSEFFCCNGHYFNREDIIDKNNNSCPICWPNGYMNR